MNQCQPLLKVENLHTYYGNIHALKGVSLEVREGEIVTLIGSNGAGKSTTLNTLSGILRCREGRILLCGRPIHNLPARSKAWPATRSTGSDRKSPVKASPHGRPSSS